jgi:hypothetical protein
MTWRNGSCECAELLIRGKRVPAPEFHNCARPALDIRKIRGDL